MREPLRAAEAMMKPHHRMQNEAPVKASCGASESSAVTDDSEAKSLSVTGLHVTTPTPPHTNRGLKGSVVRSEEALRS